MGKTRFLVSNWWYNPQKIPMKSSKMYPCWSENPQPAKHLMQVLLEELGLLPLERYSLLALFDYHGVLDLSFNESLQIIKELDQCGLKVGCLSYCRAETVHNSHQFAPQPSCSCSCAICGVAPPAWTTSGSAVQWRSLGHSARHQASYWGT